MTTLAESGERDMLICLDEVDKIDGRESVAVSNILMEITDKENNTSVYDFFFETHFDFSGVSWVGTCNNISCVDAPLISRL